MLLAQLRVLEEGDEVGLDVEAVGEEFKEAGEVSRGVEEVRPHAFREVAAHNLKKTHKTTYKQASLVNRQVHVNQTINKDVHFKKTEFIHVTQEILHWEAKNLKKYFSFAFDVKSMLKF